MFDLENDGNEADGAPIEGVMRRPAEEARGVRLIAAYRHRPSRSPGLQISFRAANPVCRGPCSNLPEAGRPRQDDRMPGQRSRNFAREGPRVRKRSPQIRTRGPSLAKLRDR